MADFPTLGKIEKKFFDDVIFPKLGASRPEVIFGPNIGLDNGIVKISEDRVLAVTTDPISFIPELGPEDSAWISVHLLANDITTSALMPAYAILNLNLPPDFSDEQFERYWTVMHSELAKLNVAVITGHTGRYGGDHSTIIGSGTLIAVGSQKSYLTPAMAQPGDLIVLTKSPMIATCGLLARVFPQTVKGQYGSGLLDSAQELLKQYPTTPDAMAAASIGLHERGVTAMHDTTEGGLFGALLELATAAGCGLLIEKEKIPVADEVRAICELFNIDPYCSLSEGALLICVKPDKANVVLKALRDQQIACAMIGRLTDTNAGAWVIDSGEKTRLETVAEDPYWKAFQRAKEEGWK